MKERVKVSLVQFTAEWLQREVNAEKMKALAEKAAQSGAELVVFPETANIGHITPVWPGDAPSYGDNVDFEDFAAKYIRASEPIPGPTTDLLGGVTKRYGIYIVVGISQTHPVIPATIYNSAALIGPNGVIGVYHKIHLGANEKHFFYPGNTADVYRTDIGNIGMTICYDNRFPELCRVLALKGAEIICAIFAGGAREGVVDLTTRRDYAHIRAQENIVYFLACSRSGREGNIEYMGRSAAAAPSGKIIAYSDTSEETILTAEISNEEILRARGRSSMFRDRRPDVYSQIYEPVSPPCTEHLRHTTGMIPPTDPAPA